MSSGAAIFADGAPVAPTLRNRIRRGRFTIVLDGAAESVRQQGWRPHLIVGDFDSVSRATLRHFARNGVELLHTPDQNYTDLEKALAWCVLRDFRSIWIAQSLGTRLDHSFTSLALLRRYAAPGREIFLFTKEERTRFVRNATLRLQGPAGRRISVLPFPNCRVRSSGLRYEMKGTRLALGEKESVSNCARRKDVRLQIQGEALVVEAVRVSAFPAP